jgi:hypothetical protein
MRKSAKFATVCIGAPAAALCFGAGTAWATPATSGHPSAASSTQHVNTGGLAVSAGGRTVLQIGNSTASTDGRSIAVAFDLPTMPGSTATANGNRSFALAIDGSTATANGNGNFVFAGDTSTAVATGDHNDVRAAFGSTNTVTGNGNTSFAIPNSHAAVTGNNNLAMSLCGGNTSFSGQGQRVTSAPCLGQ